METVEALCESIAIVDRGRVVVGGPLREIRRSAGRRLVHVSVEGDHRLPWLAGVPGARILRAGYGRTEVELDEGVNPDAILSAAIAAGATVTHFEVDEVSLEQIFIDHVGRPVDEDEHLAPEAGTAVAGPGAVAPGVARDEAAT
jgi:ABC-2 type transport system ATP-binding protein